MLERNQSRLIGDSARSLLERAGGVGRARRLRDAPSVDRAVWSEMAGLGWLGMLVPEAQGGSGLEMADTVELFTALGTFLAPEPVAPAIAAAAALTRADGADALRDAIVSGSQIAVLMPGGDGDAALAVDRGRLSGRSGTRNDPHLATDFLFGARAEGDILLLAAAAGQPGATLQTTRTVDGGSVGHLRFDDVDLASLRVLARGAAAEAALRDAADIERLGHAAVLVGLMQRALAMTVDYLGTRVQFGVPIGSFQTVQHRAASMHVDVASSRSIVREAARAVGSPRQSAAAAAAKAHACAAALRVTREAIQFHGAIGFTDEHDIGLFHRRAMALAAADGGPSAARSAWMAERERADL